MKLDHICVAVRSIDKAAERLGRVLGYTARTAKVTNTRQQVVVQFFEKEGSNDLKLIEPSGDDSPLWTFLQKRGEGLHHLGFSVGSVAEGVQELKERGARVTTEPEPGEAFDDGLIAFAYVGFGLNVELVDTDARRNLLPKEASSSLR